jgi:hypothetical protein
VPNKPRRSPIPRRRLRWTLFRSWTQEPRLIELVQFQNGTGVPDPRHPRRFHPRWMYCRVHNRSDVPVFIYGPRHPSEITTIPTSLFVLPPGSGTPRLWDCKAILIPANYSATSGSSVINGPAALKYRDFRRIDVHVSGWRYQCPRNDGVLSDAQMDFAIPSLPYSELLNLPRMWVHV